MLAVFATAVVLWTLLGTVGLFVLSRTKRGRTSGTPGKLRFVYVIPALNEGRVIAQTVGHLLDADPRASVLVVDDASDDDTARQVLAFDDARVKLLRRCMPDARKGKGEALNAAYRWLRNSSLAWVSDPRTIILGVIDADGRLKDGVLDHVREAFADPHVGACQLSVRIRNRDTNFLTRMQHFEFVSFTGVYQRGRERTGAVGLGGNGQFVRLTALRSLDPTPWSSCLTEDQDVGIRLLLAGWKTRYLHMGWVSQQAVPSLRKLIHQRTRWFQGSLQCMHHLSAILGSAKLGNLAKVDLVASLLTPLVLLLAMPGLVAGWLVFALTLPYVPGWEALARALLPAYVLAALPSLLLAYTYWHDEEDVTIAGAVVAAHLYVVYSYLWLIAGSRAALREMSGKRGWTKTARVVEVSA